MKKLLLSLFLITLALPSLSFANNECGLNDNGNIEKLNTDICEEDKLNNFFKKSVYIDEDFETDNEQDKIRKDAMRNSNKIFTSFILYILAVAIAIKLILIISDFSTGKEHATRESIAIAIVIALIFIDTAPLKSKNEFFTFNEKILQYEIKQGLKAANAIWSTYLSFFSGDHVRDRIQQKTEDEVTYQQAEVYALNLVKSRLCNQSSRQNALLSNTGALLSQQELQKSAECVFGNKDGFTLTNISDVDLTGSDLTNNVAYQQITTAPTTNIRKYTFMNSGLAFGMKAPQDGWCSTYGSFNCSTIKINNPVITGEGTKRLAEKINFEKTLLSTIKAISIDADNKKTIKAGFEQLLNKAKETQNGVINEDVKSSLEALAYIYHTKIENYLMAGYVNIDRAGTARVINSSTDLSTIQRLIDISELVSQHISNYQCSLFPSELEDAQDTAERFNQILSGTEASISTKTTAYCLDYNENRFYSSGKFFNLSDEEQREEARLYLKNEKKKAVQYFNNLAALIYQQKLAVKQSFLESLQLIEPENFYKELRREGIFSVATSIYKVLENSNTSSKLLSAFDAEHFSVVKNFSEDDYLSLDKINDDSNFSKSMFLGGYDIADELSNSISEKAIEDISTNNNHNIQEVLIYTDQTTKELKPGAISDTITDNAVMSISELLNGYASMSGYTRTIYAGDEKVIEECLNNKDCVKQVTSHNYKLEDQQFGQKLKSTSSHILATIISVVTYSDMGIDSKRTGRVAREISAFINGFSGPLVTLLILMMIIGVFFSFYFPLMIFIKLLNKSVDIVKLVISAIFIVKLLYILMIFRSTRSEAIKNLISIHVMIVLYMTVVVSSILLVFGFIEAVMMLKSVFSLHVLSGQTQTSGIFGLANSAVLTLLIAFFSFMVYKFALRMIDKVIQDTLNTFEIGNMSGSKLTDKTENMISNAANKIKK